MNQEKFDRIYQNDLTPKQRKVLPLFLAGDTDEQIAWELGATHRTTTIHQLRNISKKFGFPPEIEPDYRCNLVELFHKFKPELVGLKTLEKCGYSSYNIRFPEGPEPLNSPFYVERGSIESDCYRDIKESGVLIRIKAPNQMGKTSLIKRIMAQARNNKYSTVYLNFSLIEQEKLLDKSIFLHSFTTYVISQLPSAPLVNQSQQNLLDMVSCTSYFQKLLKQLDGVLVLALDEVDKLFKYPEVYQNFFPMLRVWNENANDSEIWEKLRVVIAHSTEDYGELDINQSPFNVGIPIKLEKFDRELIRNLAMRHGLDSQIVIPLMSLVGGHPYLVRLALYHLARQELKIDQLLKEAIADTGIYHQHLRRRLEILQANQELGEVFQQIVNHNEPVRLEYKTKQIYQLDGMGLIKITGDLVSPCYRLYREYFRDRLS